MGPLSAITVLAYFLIVIAVPAQTPDKPAQLRRIFLEFSDKPALRPVEADLSRELERSGKVIIVSSPTQADDVLAASGDVFVKGYISLNPRSGTSPNNGTPVKSGFLSVELKDKSGETLWSFLATPRFGSTRISQDLAHQVSKELLAAIQGSKP